MYCKRTMPLYLPLKMPAAVFLAGFRAAFFTLDPTNSVNDLYGHCIAYPILYFLIVNCFTPYRCILFLF